jgi:hypothetical protein
MIVMLPVFGENWGKADNLLNVIEISPYCIRAELSNKFNSIGKPATQIIKPSYLQMAD